MPHPDDLLLAAVRSAPRRYRMPPLPPTGEAARAIGADAALAFAIEAARVSSEAGTVPHPGTGDLFTSSLAALVAQALAPGGGDPAFQALVLRSLDDDVEDHVKLGAQSAADRRAIRALVDAIAHPGKLRGMAAGADRDTLARLHTLASAGAWMQLHHACAALLQVPGSDAAPRDALAAILSAPALQRLQRATALLAEPGVQRYQALCEQRGPLAGTDAAAAQGRASARVGGVAEEGTLQAFRAIADRLNSLPPPPSREGRGGGAAAREMPYLAVASLRTPRGFPGTAEKAKDEWDAAILRRSDAGSAFDVVLLAEVKATPAAASPDYARLLRGLQRLAQADATSVYAFPSSDGEVALTGASLRDLQVDDMALPPNVIYCCSAAEAQPVMLNAATKAVLLAEPASVHYAQQLVQGAVPSHAALRPVWTDLARATRLRSALNQYDTARRARAAMLHPQDLLDAVARSAGTR